MLQEFAIDPTMLGGWEQYSRVVQDCGVEHGRLISDFPNRWRKMVWEAFIANPSRTARESELMLYELEKRLPARLIPSARRYDFNDKSQDWLRQAEREHRLKPFRAIVARSNPRNSADVLMASELDKEDDNCKWKVKREDSIPRTPAAIAGLGRALFAISKQVRLVDYNLAPEALRFTKSLREILRVLSDANRNTRCVELHIEKKTDEIFFVGKCNSEWARIVSGGVELRVYRWKQRLGGPELHRRFILTERGGIWVDKGLDAGKEGEITDVGLVSEEIRKGRWEDYNRSRKDAGGNPVDTTFELVDAFTVNVTGCCRMQAPIV
jgi:hypothetical protein